MQYERKQRGHNKDLVQAVRKLCLSVTAAWGKGGRRVRGDKAEETKLSLLRVFSVLVKVPSALDSLPHQHSEAAPQEPEAQRSLLVYSKSPARQW